MAKTWRIGQFGLTSFDDHDISLSSLTDHFNDNINNNYSDYPIPSDSNFTDIPQPFGKVSEPSFTMIPTPLGKVEEPSYTPVSNSTIPTFTSIPSPDGKVDEPVYDDKIKNT